MSGMMAECIKEGFDTANRNVQVVLIRIITTVINISALFVFIGLPLLAAVLYMGLDIARAIEFMPFMLENPYSFITRYIGIALLAGGSFLLYLLFSSLLYLYSLGGILGVLGNAVVSVQYRFSLSTFFREANGNFPRLFRLGIVVFLVFILLLVVAILSFGSIMTLSHLVKRGTLMEIFLDSFVNISGIFFGILILLAFFIFTVYAMVTAVIEKKGAVESMKKTFDFLMSRPGGFLFYVLLLAGVSGVNLLFLLFEIPLKMLPFIAPYTDIFLYILNTFLQSYTIVIMWASLIAYYVKNSNYPVYRATYEI